MTIQSANKKFLLIMLFINYFIFSLSSCANGKKTKKIITLMNPEGSPRQLSLMSKIADRYQKINPLIQINLVTGVKPEKILSTISSGTGLDIFYNAITLLDYCFPLRFPAATHNNILPNPAS